MHISDLKAWKNKFCYILVPFWSQFVCVLTLVWTCFLSFFLSVGHPAGLDGVVGYINLTCFLWSFTFCWFLCGKVLKSKSIFCNFHIKKDCWWYSWCARYKAFWSLSFSSEGYSYIQNSSQLGITIAVFGTNVLLKFRCVVKKHVEWLLTVLIWAI